jgi:hypothetical protein
MKPKIPVAYDPKSIFQKLSKTISSHINSIRIVISSYVFPFLEEIISKCPSSPCIRSGSNSTYKQPTSKPPSRRVYNSMIPIINTIPTSCFYIKIKENQLIEDLTTFRTVPYLGDDIRLDFTEYSRIMGDTPGAVEHEVCGEAEELLVAYFLEQGTVSIPKITVDTSTSSSSSSSDALTSNTSLHSNSSNNNQENFVLPDILNVLSLLLEVSKKELFRVFKCISEGSWYRRHL